MKWVWEQGQAVFDDAGNVVALEGLILDITARKTDEIKLKYLSEHEPLTGLYNLRSFEERFLTAKSSDSRSAVILVNVRRYGTIISTQGYRYGQSLIQKIADCLLRIASDSHLLFHISYDRFLFYVPRHLETRELTDFCREIIAVLDEGIPQKTVSFNLGVLEMGDDPEDAETIVKNASIAAEQNGDHNRFGYCFFSQELEKIQHRKNAIRRALSESLDKEDDPCLYMNYQPIVDLKTNVIVGFEALARYRNEELGAVSPAEFIPIAESSQLMLPLGRKILDRVFAFAERLSREGYGTLALTFNISAIQLLNDNFLAELEEYVRNAGIDPRNLTVEITESVFSDNYVEINKRLDIIQAMGMKIAIDDFGTGYSSLARERELNINCLKIDKYFIDKLTGLHPEKAITGDIISMAHKLGHYVVAEGVEFEKQRRYLADHHCDMMQGYLFSRPVDEDNAINMLKEARNSGPQSE